MKKAFIVRLLGSGTLVQGFVSEAKADKHISEVLEVRRKGPSMYAVDEIVIDEDPGPPKVAEPYRIVLDFGGKLEYQADKFPHREVSIAARELIELALASVFSNALKEHQISWTTFDVDGNELESGT